MSSILLTLLRTIGIQLLTKKFGIWLAKLAAKSTKNMIDDNVILLLEGGLNNDPKQIEKAAKDILLEVSKRFEKDA